MFDTTELYDYKTHRQHSLLKTWIANSARAVANRDRALSSNKCVDRQKYSPACEGSTLSIAQIWLCGSSISDPSALCHETLVWANIKGHSRWRLLPRRPFSCVTLWNGSGASGQTKWQTKTCFVHTIHSLLISSSFPLPTTIDQLRSSLKTQNFKASILWIYTWSAGPLLHVLENNCCGLHMIIMQNQLTHLRVDARNHCQHEALAGTFPLVIFIWRLHGS